MDPIRYQKGEDGIVTLTMDLQGSVNKLSAEFSDSLRAVIERLYTERADIKGAIFISAKETFLAGADLTQLATLKPDHAQALFDSVSQMKAIFRKLEKLGKPVVACINGAALGGGLELALACHARIMLNHPKVRVGLPEVKLGLLPGGGGVVRLTWMLGAQAALPVLTETKEYRAKEALSLGLITDVADTVDELIAKAKAWILVNPSPSQPWDRSDYKIPGGKFPSPQILQMLNIGSAMLYKRTRGAMPAPEEIMKIVAQALTVDFDTALRVETRHFLAVATSPVAHNMISTLFFQMREVTSGKSRPQGFPPSSVNKLGVLGAGMMGRGIALVSAQAGLQVALKDISLEAAQKGKAYCEKALEKNPKKEEILARIHPTAQLSDLKDADLIIEAVFENVELKGAVTKDAEGMLKPATGFFASNTSTLPITLLAKATSRPENFIGIHFFSPVEKMPLVEIIVGKETSEQTLAKAFDYVMQIKKVPIVVNDSRGFFTSRVIGTYIGEAIAMLEEGVHPARIERVAREAGFPVGPLALWDEVSQRLTIEIAKTNAGLDDKIGRSEVGVAAKSAQQRVAETLVNNYNRGGKAHGGGVYEYPLDGQKYLWPKIIELYHKPSYKISDEDIKGRLKFRQSVETLRCLEEGVLRSVSDANIGSILGIGFPPNTGGVIQAVNSMGSTAFLKLMEEYSRRFGQGFAPPSILRSAAASGALISAPLKL